MVLHNGPPKIIKNTLFRVLEYTIIIQYLQLFVYQRERENACKKKKNLDHWTVFRLLKNMPVATRVVKYHVDITDITIIFI